MARVKFMRRMRSMQPGSHNFQMPEDVREVLNEAELDDDEDGYPWDPDRGGDLGNYDDDEEDDG